MNKQVQRLAAGSLVGLGLALAAARPAVAASGVTAVPSLDLKTITGIWYEIARLPNKHEKKCKEDGTVLYALDNKKRSFQVGYFCPYKNTDTGDWSSTGTQGKLADGRLKLGPFFPFTTKYYVLAEGDPIPTPAAPGSAPTAAAAPVATPSAAPTTAATPTATPATPAASPTTPATTPAWLLVGSPNHKLLWVLSRTAVMSPDVLAQIRAKADAEGYKTAKLISQSQHTVPPPPAGSTSGSM